MLPKVSQIEIPLLGVLMDLGGQAQPKEVYPLVTRRFSDLRDEDLAETLPSGGNKWTNRIQWVRQRLVEKGEIDSSERGVWRITEKGRRRLEATGKEGQPSVPPTFLELYEDYETAFHAHVLQRLHDLSPREFEEFARRLLAGYGFVEVSVTQVSNDGGIDGYGRLRLGLATMNVAFQCKRWEGNVGRPEVDRFRGAIQGQFEQGVFFTTSDFTPAARDASLRPGAVPIILLNGNSIVDLMIERGLGVERRPLYAYYDRLDDFELESR